ncbi:hypothetical protein scyTo_0015433 [Scyliorhinus torazame]|uniref:Uncharacterized protein n=1 Tax=Scyliorhinus torazame TaxID=75743 RepID=A0A401PSP8_SCYTO|nr:hypothetical protein [Scyliorhinus torazame]
MPDSDFTGRRLEARQKRQSGKVKHKQYGSEEDTRNVEKLKDKSDKTKGADIKKLTEKSDKATGTDLEHTKRNNRFIMLRPEKDKATNAPIRNTLKHLKKVQKKHYVSSSEELSKLESDDMVRVDTPTGW